ncbi:formyltransferase family protein [Psychroserpens sp. NJDZ02]|uniref:formyltransferase family protein n=1 Tax=Psychroserpens sp. NJDZ02 TaxID=2570561 RepID=UPI0010A8B6B2|nr:formyltransferase family protein [Psychroserpens sp. NJDZ02]QCE41142.1 methionyl-tRNA formyltransferase [Psychroserpens sp. NJDZ02]
MKFAFVTCVQIGLSCMKSIYNSNGKLDLIITIPDEKAKKKSGRIYVDEFANKHDIPVLKVNHINDDIAIETIIAHDIDWLFIIGWSQIASENVIHAPKLGAIGAHPTLLPVGRGRAAIPWAIIKGLDKTGVSFFKMDKGVDTGLILGQEIIPLSEKETATTLYNKVNTAHEDFIKVLYKKLEENKVVALKQDDSKATYWEGRKPEDGKILLNMSLDKVDKLVRATTKPYPGAFIIDGDYKTIIWEGVPSEKKMDNDSYLELKLYNGYFYATNFERQLILD